MVSPYDTRVFSLLVAVHPAAFIAASLQRCSHTNGSVSAHRISASCLRFQQHKTVSLVIVFYYVLSDLSQSKRGLLPDRWTCVYQLVKRPNRFLRAFLAPGQDRLYSGTFLQTLQSAGHHSATFLIVASKCSLDTLFRRIAWQTCATRHAWR